MLLNWGLKRTKSDHSEKEKFSDLIIVVQVMGK